MSVRRGVYRSNGGQQVLGRSVHSAERVDRRRGVGGLGELIPASVAEQSTHKLLMKSRGLNAELLICLRVSAEKGRGRR